MRNPLCFSQASDGLSYRVIIKLHDNTSFLTIFYEKILVATSMKIDIFMKPCYTSLGTPLSYILID